MVTVTRCRLTKPQPSWSGINQPLHPHLRKFHSNPALHLRSPTSHSHTASIVLFPPLFSSSSTFRLYHHSTNLHTRIADTTDYLLAEPSVESLVHRHPLDHPTKKPIRNQIEASSWIDRIAKFRGYRKPQTRCIMSEFNGRRAPNFSQYLNDLNAIPSPYDQAVQQQQQQQDSFNLDADLSLFTNAEFFDFDKFGDLNLPSFESAEDENLKTENKQNAGQRSDMEFLDLLGGGKFGNFP